MTIKEKKKRKEMAKKRESSNIQEERALGQQEGSKQKKKGMDRTKRWRKERFIEKESNCVHGGAWKGVGRKYKTAQIFK